MANNSLAPPIGKVALWNPENLSLWNLLFTPAFGAWIQARNWSALGEDKRAKESMYWFFGTLNLIAWMMPFFSFGDIVAAIGIVNGIWHFGFSKDQEDYVKEKIGSVYGNKSLKVPFKVASIGLFLILAFKLSLAARVCQ